MGLVVDTSVFVQAERAYPQPLPAFTPQGLLRKVGEDIYAISAITLMELAFGHSFRSRLPAALRDRILYELREEFTVVDINDRLAVSAGELNAQIRRGGHTIGILDVLIAATALELGFGVLTHNTRHFNYVPNLRVIDAASF